MLRAALSPSVALFLCLIETNIRQRGVMPNPTKYGRCIKELERIYGIRDGSAGNADPNNKNLEINNGADFLKPKSEALEEIGIPQHTANRFEMLAKHPGAVITAASFIVK